MNEATERNDLYARHLQGMVRIPTLSNADPSKMDFARFDALHKYLEDTYPLIHRRMTREIICQAGLLYKLTGRPSDKLPLLLMAHQDVVPEGDPARWTHPPYAAEIAEGCLWGRGSTDCKCVILAQMEAVEALLAEGFEPDYDLYLAYGCNEEVQAEVKSADVIARTLEARGVRLGCVIDEGGSFRAADDGASDGTLAQLWMGEKAYQDYELSCDSAGGHSMEPGQGTALGALARGIAAVEANPMPYRLTDLVRDQLKALAAFQNGEQAKWYADPDAHFDQLCALAREDRKLDSLLHTTCAVTMAHGSDQSNVLPDHATAIVNCRVLQGDTAEDLLRHFRAILPKDVHVRKLLGSDPEPAGRAEGRAFELIVEVAHALYGEQTYILPGLLAGGTDSRFYSRVCDSVYRFCGFFQDDRWGAAHAMDEKIPVDALSGGVDFFRQILLRY